METRHQSGLLATMLSLNKGIRVIDWFSVRSAPRESCLLRIVLMLNRAGSDRRPMMEKLVNVAGVLFDLEGVLFVGDRVIDGAVEAVKQLQQRDIPCRFMTNTTTKSRQALADKMRRMGFEVCAEEILTAPTAALHYLEQRQPRSCHFILDEAVKAEFDGWPQSDSNPEVVVIGDIGPNWDYQLMNHLLTFLMQGSELLALHKSKYWQTPQGLQIDIGAFIAGLEYASDKQATVVGKPSAAFFSAGVESLGCAPGQIIMVGDDIESDVGGAQGAGLRGVLVKTGKYREEVAAASAVSPDAVIDSVAQLTAIL